MCRRSNSKRRTGASPGKSGDRLQAAGLRKRGRTLGKIVRIMGCGVSTTHWWLSRMEREGLDGRHDCKSPGRQRLLNPDQEKTVEGDLDGTPRESGFERGSWNARWCQAYTRQVRRTVQRQVGHSAGAPARVLGQKTADPPRTTAPRQRSMRSSSRRGRRPPPDGGPRAGPSWLSTRLPCATRRYGAGGSGVGEEGRRCPSTTPGSPSAG